MVLRFRWLHCGERFTFKGYGVEDYICTKSNTRTYVNPFGYEFTVMSVDMIVERVKT